ncbi:hypothetical protein BCR33DRAFT_353268 [Rhizoclosmatium globosum]|uniref:Uncharacterized protein n=1 Tax=Rhizoclosmatium globosum TaxID=329046 RepID=A0A1Y2C234_9FUNG|nr:hypothetical protein BCR33DRAFT_353268 [Rhizoclosmatium globosum]|eukprot:ORY41098.1 hypothetical protein BCR33DRAFT_353268 [Rhizoclosmatium globosum]
MELASQFALFYFQVVCAFPVKYIHASFPIILRMITFASFCLVWEGLGLALFCPVLQRRILTLLYTRNHVTHRLRCGPTTHATPFCLFLPRIHAPSQVPRPPWKHRQVRPRQHSLAEPPLTGTAAGPPQLISVDSNRFLEAPRRRSRTQTRQVAVN